MHENGRPGMEIQPIPCTGPAEFFRPNLTDEELKGVGGKLNIKKKTVEKSDFFRQVFRLGLFYT
jgi:hypothetical protein